MGKQSNPNYPCLSVVLAVAEVFIGSVTKGDPSMRKPPVIQSTVNSDVPMFYNTTVNDLEKPEIFVKYKKEEFCPLYFIHLNRPDC